MPIVRAADSVVRSRRRQPGRARRSPGRRRRRRVVAGMDTGGRGPDHCRHLRPPRRQVPGSRRRGAAPRPRPNRRQADRRKCRAAGRAVERRGTRRSARRGRAAAALGFPVMLKAAAGGGRAGIRRVDDEAELLAVIEHAAAEAQASFGDPRLYLEALLAGCPPPRGDGRGRSTRQGLDVRPERRHAAPPGRQGRDRVGRRRPDAPPTSESIRGAAATLMPLTGYRGVATVAFVHVPGGGPPRFLEVYPRLPPEHAVIEETTGRRPRAPAAARRRRAAVSTASHPPHVASPCRPGSTPRIPSAGSPGAGSRGPPAARCRPGHPSRRRRRRGRRARARRPDARRPDAGVGPVSRRGAGPAAAAPSTRRRS